jgi:hypothetical protein
MRVKLAQAGEGGGCTPTTFLKVWWQYATLFVYFSYFLTYIQSFNHIHTVNSPRPLSIPFHYIYHTSKVAVYTPAEWADTITLFHVSSPVKICTLWFKQILRPICQPAVARRKRHLTANYPTNISVSFRAGR